ncbi:hypothetical protein CDCA_CDCA02G0530 [Cyanidium caldarium]|uniref:BRCT domain-containing protein n=1 Tax=Cyanidium caldarium TaxID=2771 RepID=A0AAV9IQH9_CYACA|nr:hypothetical protein CDCA_CDCA02G0530 [Cyanidium caldarium]
MHGIAKRGEDEKPWEGVAAVLSEDISTSERQPLLEALASLGARVEPGGRAEAILGAERENERASFIYCIVPFPADPTLAPVPYPPQSTQPSAFSRLVGVPAVLESARWPPEQAPLPCGTHPLLSRCLEGTVVCSTGTSRRQVDRIARITTLLGGAFVPDLTTAVTHLLVARCDTEKCRLASPTAVHRLNLRWIEDCWARRVRCDEQLYSMRPLEGLHCSATQLSAEERGELQRTLVSLGASFSHVLTPDCTHLVAKRPQGDKYAFANAHHMPVVYPRWVQQCAARQTWLPPEECTVRQTPGKRKRDPTATSIVESAATGDDPGRRHACVHASPPEIVSSTDDWLFRSCGLYLYRVEGTERMQALECIRGGGGTVLRLWSDLVSHVVLGRGALQSPLETEAQLAFAVAQDRGVAFVNSDWLQQCRRARHLLPPDDSMVELLKGRADGTRETMATGGRSPPPDTRQLDVSRTTSRGAAARCLRGLVFSLRPLLQHDARQAQQLAALLRDCGATVHGAWPDCPQLPLSVTFDYAVGVHGSCGSVSDTGGAPLVTALWVRDCVRDCVRHDVRARLAYQALPCAVPLPDMSALTVTMSGFFTSARQRYGPADRYALTVSRRSLAELVSLLGARYSDRLCRGQTSCVVCERPVGAKYQRAAEWGIPAVTVRWLLDSMAAGRRLDWERYRWEAPAGECGERLSELADALNCAMEGAQREEPSLQRAEQMRIDHREVIAAENKPGDSAENAAYQPWSRRQGPLSAPDAMFDREEEEEEEGEEEEDTAEAEEEAALRAGISQVVFYREQDSPTRAPPPSHSDDGLPPPAVPPTRRSRRGRRGRRGDADHSASLVDEHRA